MLSSLFRVDKTGDLSKKLNENYPSRNKVGKKLELKNKGELEAALPKSFYNY